MAGLMTKRGTKGRGVSAILSLLRKAAGGRRRIGVSSGEAIG
jgi:hypothetical protein